jgi:hypothetical protein
VEAIAANIMGNYILSFLHLRGKLEARLREEEP